MARRKNMNSPTQIQTAKFDMLSPMLDSLLVEIRELSKKKQDGTLNPLKVKMVNRILSDIKAILESDPSSEYLDLLEEDTLPQNSDAVLVLGQFRAAMNQFKRKHYGREEEYGSFRWFTQEKPGEHYNGDDE